MLPPTTPIDVCHLFYEPAFSNLMTLLRVMMVRALSNEGDDIVLEEILQPEARPSRLVCILKMETQSQHLHLVSKLNLLILVTGYRF